MYNPNFNSNIISNLDKSIALLYFQALSFQKFTNFFHNNLPDHNHIILINANIPYNYDHDHLNMYINTYAIHHFNQSLHNSHYINNATQSLNTFVSQHINLFFKNYPLERVIPLHTFNSIIKSTINNKENIFNLNLFL